MYAKYGKNDELEGVFESLEEAIETYYKVSKQNKILFNKKRRVICSSIKYTKTNKTSVGWYKF